FIAVSAEARRKFWLDRARTAAIARHTNAFKINEDVVLPLARMGEYTDEIERINIELSTANKLAVIGELERVFAAPPPLARAEDTELGNLPRLRSPLADDFLIRQIPQLGVLGARQ